MMVADKMQDTTNEILQQPQSSVTDFEAPGSTGSMIVYAILALISFIILCLHRVAPKILWSHVDVFSSDHYTKEGESTVKRRTPLGFSFTVAFLPVAIIILIGLSVSNRPVETPSLQATSPLIPNTNKRMEASTGHLSVNLTLPLQLKSQQYVDACRGVTMTPNATGCSAKAVFVPPATCAVTGTNCTLGLITVFRFDIPWNQRWVEWEVTTETANVGHWKTISGQVVCAAPERMLDVAKVDIQAMASYRNDTTSIAIGAETNGYDLYSLPHILPRTRGIAATDDWTLEITLRRSPLVHMVNISRPLSLFPLLALCLSTVLSFLGVWRGFFKSTEYGSWQAMNLRNMWQAKRAKTNARGVTGSGGDEEARGGNDASETKNDDDGLEMQAAVRIRTASTEMFDDGRSPSMSNPAYGHHKVSVVDDDQRIARLEKRADEAKTRAYRTDIETNSRVAMAENRVGAAEKRADEAEKRADAAERMAGKRANDSERFIEERVIARILKLEQRLERSLAKTEGNVLVEM
jgi:hypothetical protein